MNDHDDLERRLRGALNRPRPSDAVDAEDFLGRVHHGAKVRRVKRRVSLVAASVVAVAGGGLAINASDLLGGSATPVAADHTTTKPAATVGSPSADTPPTTLTTPTHTPRQKVSQSPSNEPQPVTISANGSIAATDVHAVSLTATGTAHQWVLAKTPGSDCGRAACATVFATEKHGVPGSWTDIGQLPAPPATEDSPAPDSVSQLRFTKRGDGSGIYDGWAFGDALWSTHDSGKTCSTLGAPAGNVTHLESWGDFVYAAVSSSGNGQDTATLYRSPTTRNHWQPVRVTSKAVNGLSSVQALTAAKNVVALIDSGSGVRPVVYVSSDGVTWEPQRPCPRGTSPADLSTASDPTGTVGSLWVTCQGVAHTVILYTDTTNLGTWNSVPNDSFPPTVVVAAQSSTLAYVAGDNVPGIQRVSTTKPATTVPAVGVGSPVFFGFTNERYGYLLNSSGHILSTTDGGGSWVPYAVSDTTP
jgi:hypothetical protein